MKKKFKMENLDCANCAAKIENEIARLEGVTSCSVSFMTQKMVLEAPDDQFDALTAKAKKIIRKLEPDVTMRV